MCPGLVLRRLIKVLGCCHSQINDLGRVTKHFHSAVVFATDYPREITLYRTGAVTPACFTRSHSQCDVFKADGGGRTLVSYQNWAETIWLIEVCRTQQEGAVWFGC